MLPCLLALASLNTQIAAAQRAFSVMADMSVYPELSSTSSAWVNRGSGPVFAASVHYLGACHGILRIECMASVAFKFTERICGIDRPHEFNADVEDAIGELINIIGGNLKGLLPPDTRLAIPQVFTPGPDRGEAGAAPQITALDFNSEYGAFRLSLLSHPGI